MNDVAQTVATDVIANDPVVGYIGAGVVITLWVLNTVWSKFFELRKAETARTDIKKLLYEIRDYTEDLHKMHDVTNPDGSRPWMNSGLERTMQEVSDSIKESSNTMKKLSESIQLMIIKLSNIESKVN